MILNGITRQTLLTLTEALGIVVAIRPFSVAEARGAREAMLSSATTFALPITRLDGQPVGDGRPGPVARALRQAYLDAGAGVRS
jgi:D-alanine transaminase